MVAAVCPPPALDALSAQSSSATYVFPLRHGPVLRALHSPSAACCTQEAFLLQRKMHVLHIKLLVCIRCCVAVGWPCLPGHVTAPMCTGAPPATLAQKDHQALSSDHGERPPWYTRDGNFSNRNATQVVSSTSVHVTTPHRKEALTRQTMAGNKWDIDWHQTRHAPQPCTAPLQQSYSVKSQTECVGDHAPTISSQHDQMGSNINPAHSATAPNLQCSLVMLHTKENV